MCKQGKQYKSSATAQQCKANERSCWNDKQAAQRAETYRWRGGATTFMAPGLPTIPMCICACMYGVFYTIRARPVCGEHRRRATTTAAGQTALQRRGREQCVHSQCNNNSVRQQQAQGTGPTRASSNTQASTNLHLATATSETQHTDRWKPEVCGVYGTLVETWSVGRP